MTQSTDTPKPISLDEEDREVLEGVQFFLDHGRTPDQILGMTHPSQKPLVARYLVQQGEVLDSRPEPYYGFRFPETDGDVTLMDRVSPYPPEFVTADSVMRLAIDTMKDQGMHATEILAHFSSEERPHAARYLVQQGEVLRSEFRSEEEAEAFWAHVGQ